MRNLEISHSVPFGFSYWVVPGKFLAGCYPDTFYGTDDRSRIRRSIVEHGILHFINLMEEGELEGIPLTEYEEEIAEIAESMGVDISFERMPIKDRWITSREHMGRILDRIDACIADERPVYVHCLAGRGRTGTVVGCYLARHGIASREDVLSLIQELRKGTDNVDLDSPEDEEQRVMIRSWNKGE